MIRVLHFFTDWSFGVDGQQAYVYDDHQVNQHIFDAHFLKPSEVRSYKLINEIVEA